jgi:hypothetical protein
MPTTTIRVSLHTRNILHELAHEAGLSMQEVADRAIEHYYREQVLAATNAALRADTDAWHDWQAEQAAWDENPLLAIAGIGESEEPTDMSNGRDEEILRAGLHPLYGWGRGGDLEGS